MLPIPLEQITVNIGGRDLAVLQPDAAWVQRRYRALQDAGENPPPPYWSRVWHSAKALGAYLYAHPDLVRGKKVLELAAGMGLPARVAAESGATVVVSDYLPEAVDVLRENIRVFGLQNIEARLIDWNAIPDDLEADVLLLSDVNYEPASFEPLLQVIRAFLQRKTTVLLSTPQRLMARPFVDALQPFLYATENMEIGEAVITILSLQ